MSLRHSVYPVLLAALWLGGCATRAVDVQALPADPAAFASWDCERLDAEMDRVQQRAAELAYTVDARASTNIVALGVGVMVFWPALIAMQPPGAEAAELGRLKGRFDALQYSARRRACPEPSADLPAARAANLPVAVGERLVYEDRESVRAPVREIGLRLRALRRDELEFTEEAANSAAAPSWRQDLAGNVTRVPQGQLQWPRLLLHEMTLGQVIGGEIGVSGDADARARVRGQVVAVGPQTVASRRFDVAIVELFGDAQRGDRSTRLDGVLVVDRNSGVLLRLELQSAQPGFTLQRRLMRIEPAP